jgi:hypothetical protein
MSSPPIRIKIGASVDESVDRVFETIEKRAKRLGGTVGKSVKQGTQEAAEGAAELGEKWNETATGMDGRTKRFRDDQVDAWKQIGKVAEQEMNRAAKAQSRAVDRFATRTSHRATRFLAPTAPLASFATRAASDIARGAGVTFDPGSAIQRNIERQSLAVAISNSGFIEGAAGPNGKRVDPSFIQAHASKIGKDLAADPTQILEGIAGFTKKTGDLSTALEIAPQMAKLARAANANISEVMVAAGGIATNLRGVDDKAGAMDAIMRNLIAQGKLGAVELEDFAKEIPKLAAQANRFAGGSAHNIKELAGLAQLSMASGGATSAQQAATSVARLVDTLSTPARAKGFHAAGIQTEVKGPNGIKVLRDPVEVIIDSLKKTKADPEKLKALFSSSIGSRPAEALAGTFRAAGGGKAGEAAVREQLRGFSEGQFSDKALADNLKTVLTSDAASAQQFQTALDETVNAAQGKLLPALRALEPSALKAADALSKAVVWATKNPFEAGGLAFAAAIARAGVESALRAGIEAVIARAAAAFGIGTATSAAGGAGAAAGGAGALAAGGAAVLATGGLAAAGYESYQLTKDIQRTGGVGATYDLLTKGPAKPLTPDEYTARYGPPAQAPIDIHRALGGIGATRASEPDWESLFAQQNQQMEGLRQEIARLRASTLSVRVENQPEVPQPVPGRVHQ